MWPKLIITTSERKKKNKSIFNYFSEIVAGPPYRF